MNDNTFEFTLESNERLFEASVNRAEILFYTTVDDMIQLGTGGDPYDGPYNVTPSEVEQTLSTQGKSMAQNVVIAAIPSNYGRITYNGYELTVS